MTQAEAGKMMFRIMCAIVAFMIALILLLAFTGCSPKVVTVTERHDYYHNHTDSVRQVDSVFTERQTVIMQVDSAMMAEYGIQLRSNERAWLVKVNELEKKFKELATKSTDTVIKVDSIPVPYPVERKLTKWQQLKLDIGEFIIVSLFVLIASFCIWFARRKTGS